MSFLDMRLFLNNLQESLYLLLMIPKSSLVSPQPTIKLSSWTTNKNEMLISFRSEWYGTFHSISITITTMIITTTRIATTIYQLLNWPGRFLESSINNNHKKNKKNKTEITTKTKITTTTTIIITTTTISKLLLSWFWPNFEGMFQGSMKTWSTTTTTSQLSTCSNFE